MAKKKVKQLVARVKRVTKRKLVVRGSAAKKLRREVVVEWTADKALPDMQHETFCRHMARGSHSATWCYIKTYADPEKEKADEIKSARQLASRLLTKANIQARIEWIRSESLKKVQFEIEEAAQFCVNVIRTPVGEIDQDSPLAQEIKPTQFGDQVKLPAKLDAMDRLAKLKGWFKDEAAEQGRIADALGDLVALARRGQTGA